MKTPLPISSSEVTRRVTALIEECSPVSVFASWPRCGTSSECHVVEDVESFQKLVARLGEGTQVTIDSVWSIKTSKRAIVATL